MTGRPIRWVHVADEPDCRPDERQRGILVHTISWSDSPYFTVVQSYVDKYIAGEENIRLNWWKYMWLIEETEAEEYLSIIKRAKFELAAGDTNDGSQLTRAASILDEIDDYER